MHKAADPNQLQLPLGQIQVIAMRLSNIPMPPSSNNIYETIMIRGRVMRCKSRHLKVWEKNFADWCLVNYTAVSSLKARIKEMKPCQFIEIETQFHFNRSSILTKKHLPKRNDTSNRLKVIHDAISNVIDKDDAYFFDGTFSKRVLPTDLEPEVCHVVLKIIDAPWMVPSEA